MGRKEQVREREALAQFGLKRCSKCRGVKPRVNFYKMASAWDGLQPKCSCCIKRYSVANKQRRSEYTRRYREENREKVAEGLRQWREANPDYNRQYLQTPEGRAASRKGSRKRRALKRSVQENFTAEDEAFVFERDGYRCVDCGITNQEHIAQFGQRLHIDHVLPLSKGHALTRENAALRCRSCNSRKKDQ